MIALIPAALLWVPADDFTAWDQLAEQLKDKDDVRLTIALSPSMLRPEVEAALQPLIDDKRVEVAARIDGDPWLPAVAQIRRHDVPRRITSAADAFRLAFASASARGFVPAGGAWEPAWQPLLKAAGFQWAATGLPPWPADGLAVIDEALGPHKNGALFEMLVDPPGRRWMTLSEAFAVSSNTPSAPWAANPLETPEGSRLWLEYENTANAVKRYQNSGSAELAKLSRASQALHAAQASRLYKDADELALRGHLDKALEAIGALSNEVRISSGGRSLRLDGGKMSVAVEWNEAEVSFMVRASTTLPPNALFDLYIDVNGIPGAGRQTLLPGRTGQLPPKDAWEVALEAASGEAKLYRAGAEAAKTPAQMEPNGVKFAFPRAALRGNPGGWGYAAGVFPAEGGAPLATLGPALRGARVKKN